MRSRFVSTEHRRRLLGVLAALPLAALAAFALRPNLAAALVLLGLAGATGAYVITVGATFLTRVPNDIRGSAGGLYRTGLRVAQGVGVGIGGLVAQWLGSAGTTIALAGVTGLLLAVPVALAWRRVDGPGTEPVLS